MRALITASMVEPFNTKELYNKVIDKFLDYSLKKITINSIAEESLSRNTEIHEECHTQNTSNPTWKATVKSDKLLDEIIEYENKINFLKTQFTKEEQIIYDDSIVERELDKVIMDKVCRDPHKYYQVKKSCYLKVALCFGLIKPREKAQNSKVVPMVAQSL